MKKRYGLLFALFAALPASAQSPEALDAAKRYMETPGMREMIDSMSSPEMMVQGLVASLPSDVKVTDEQIARIGEIMSGAFAAIQPEMERVMLESTARHFTVEEIDAMIEFYSSDIGASVMSKMQPYMQDSMQQMMPQLMQVQQQVMPQVIEVLQPK